MIAVIVLAVGAIFIDLGIYLALDVARRQQVDSTLRAQATSIQAGLTLREGQLLYLGGPLPTETSDGVAVDEAVVTPDGILAASSNESFLSQTLVEFGASVLRTRRSTWLDTTDARAARRRVFVTPLSLPGLKPSVLLISASLEPAGSQLRTMLIVGLGSALAVAAGGGLAYWLTGRALTPVRQIAALARSLSEAELHRSVEVNVPDDELGELVDTFNSMLARLDLSFRTLRGFTADVSHELRTPLALMRTDLELAISEPPDREGVVPLLQGLQTEVDDLTHLVDELLLLARADAGQLKPAGEYLDVIDFLEETVARWSSIARQHEVALEVGGPPSGRIWADPRLTRQLLDNLISNAVRYSPIGGRVLVSAQREGSTWRFRVADEGRGVPLELRPRLFKRFATVEVGRSPRHGGGAGLGLAICAAIAEAQGGAVQLVESATAGAVFDVRLPTGPPIAAGGDTSARHTA